jgi:transposase
VRTKRHRLNQRGNRQLNWAIHVAAVTQLRYPCAGREYYDRKRAEGKNTKEAIRALKRQLSNVIYRSWSPTLADSSSDRRAREDNQERHEIQRDRLNILNGRLFG